MKIALIGYGKMGKAIEKIALERGHTIHAKVNLPHEIAQIIEADVAIEFTQPDAAYGNLVFCAENNIPVVCGTTAWYDQYEEVKDLFIEREGALLTATNFSIGVNIFFKLNAELAKMMNKFSDYEVSMEEIHHLQKKDHPSGTATTLAEGIIDNVARVKGVQARLEDEQAANDKAEVDILCKREEGVPGTHTVKYHSAIDDIVIEHKAHNRQGFALGSCLAAEWLQGKKGVFKMSDVLGF